MTFFIVSLMSELEGMHHKWRNTNSELARLRGTGCFVCDATVLANSNLSQFTKVSNSFYCAILMYHCITSPVTVAQSKTQVSKQY